jgi:autotransporter-associated beta strand protein
MTGVGTLVLSGTNAYTGGTSISTGTVSVSADNNLGAPTGAIALSNNGTLAVTGTGFSSGRSLSVDPSTGGNLNVASGGKFTANGNGTWTSGAGSLNLTGPGTVTLNSGTGSYTMNINANSGTLAGTASVVGNITINTGGTIAPGNVATSNGTMTATSATLAANSNFNFDIATANTLHNSTAGSAGSAGTDWNLLALSSLTVNSTPISQTVVSLTGSVPGTFNPAATYQWDFITTTSGGSLAALQNDFALSLGSFASEPGLFTIGAGSLGTGGFVAIDYSPSAVPEPGSMILAGLAAMGMAGMGWRQRRRQQAAGKDAGQQADETAGA